MFRKLITALVSSLPLATYAFSILIRGLWLQLGRPSITGEGRVVLSGDVDMIQENGKNLRAERIVYLVERERIIAEPAQESR